MLYPSVDKILTKVESKYLLVHVASKRSKQMLENKHFQMKQNEYVNLYDDVIATIKKIDEGFDPLILTNIIELKYLEYLQKEIIIIKIVCKMTITNNIKKNN